jgi:hypothetical protein
MISNKKVVNIKVVELIETYKFGLGHFFIQIRWVILNLSFKI